MSGGKAGWRKAAGGVPEFKREQRGVVLITQREAQAIYDMLCDFPRTMVGNEDLDRAYRVVGKQLEWIKQHRLEIEQAKADKIAKDEQYRRMMAMYG
jgi:hypothetical protein